MSATLDFFKGLKGNARLTLLLTHGTGLYFGLATGIAEGIWDSYKKNPNLIPINKNDLYQSIMTSSAILGAFFGSIAAGFMADSFGRRSTLMVSTIIAIFGNSICMLGKLNFWILAFGRLTAGYGLGGSGAVTPLYFSELAKNTQRSFYGGNYQFAITFSIFLGSISKFFVGSKDAWYYFVASIYLPLIMMAATIPFLQPSPRYLVGKDDAKAKELFKEIFESEEEIEKEMEDIKRSKNKKINWNQFLQYALLKATILAFLFAIWQQWTGINAIIYYFGFLLNPLFNNDALKIAFLNTALMLWNCISSMVSIPIITKFKRRPLILIGLLCMIISLFFVGTAFYLPSPYSAVFAAIGMGFFILWFELSAGPLFPLFINEIFPESLRGRVGSVMSGIQWLMNFILTISFPSISNAINFFVFYIFAMIGICILVVYVYILPETKDCSMQEIQEILEKRGTVLASSKKAQKAAHKAEV